MEKIRLKVHLAICRNCDKFAKKNTQLTKTIKKSGLKTCPKEYKEEWKEDIKSAENF